MKIEKREIVSLDRAYSLAVLPPADGRSLPALLAGSEGDGPLLLIEPPYDKPAVLADEPGGFISLAGWADGGRRHVLASAAFKPGFDAADCRLLLFTLDGKSAGPPVTVAVLPYAHRIALATMRGRRYALASTLCSGKAFKEDWSQPGGIHIAAIPDDPAQPWSFAPVAGGLRKNHGFDLARLDPDGPEGYLASCMDGLFFVHAPADIGVAWVPQLLAAGEHSDAWAVRWETPVQTEIFAIRPFHGHILTRYASTGGHWHGTDLADDLDFGHIVWAGETSLGPGVIAGSRRSRREIRFYPYTDGTICHDYAVLDENVGAAQMALLSNNREHTLMAVSASTTHKIILYNISRL